MDQNTPSNYRRNFSALRNAISNLVNDAIEDSWSAFEAWELPNRMGEMMEYAREEVDDMFADTFPKIDMRDTGEAIVIEANLPGVDPDNIDIEVSDDEITIAGMAGYESEDTDEDHNYYSFERYYGTFERTVPLPDLVDAESTVGEIRNGTLMIVLPKLVLDAPAAPVKKKKTAAKKKATPKKKPASKKATNKKTAKKSTPKTKTSAKKAPVKKKSPAKKK
jgi:HSP20 family protein